MRREILVTLLAVTSLLVARHAYLGQFEWLSGASDEEINLVIEETSSIAGFRALEEFSPDEAEWVYEEIRQDLRRQRGGMVSNTTARRLMVEVRRRHSSLLVSAPDDFNKEVIEYQNRWLRAVKHDAKMCERVLALGDAGVLVAWLDEFADEEVRDNSAVFEAMLAATQNPIAREAPTIDEWTQFYNELLDQGFSAADLLLLDPENVLEQLPEACAAMERYLVAVNKAQTPLAEKIRAEIAKSLMAL